MSKTCTKCGETKPLDAFHRHKGRADGVQSECKGCKREYARRYYEENRDKRMDYSRRYREGNRDKEREHNRRYYEENRDKELDRRSRYYEENRDILNQESRVRHAQYSRTSSLLATKKGAHYSPEEEAFILADNGMTDYQKAIELGRTYKSVAHRLHILRKTQAQ